MKKLRRGLKSKAKKGEFTGGRVPFGYKIVDGKYTIDETQAKKIKEVFKLFNAGHSYIEIDRKLGIPYYNVKIYLHNEIYSAGTIIRSGSPISVPNIITPEEFALARSRFSNYTRRKKAEKYLLTGKLVCGTCGSLYKGCGNNDSKYNYYRATCNCCKKRFRKDELDQQILDSIYSILKSDENIEILTDKVYEKLKLRVKNLNSPASKESLIAKKKRLLTMVESGALPGDDPDLRERLSIIDAELMKLSGASNSQNIINRAMVNSYILGVKEHLTKVSALVGAFINKIEVMPNSSFKITYQVEKIFGSN